MPSAHTNSITAISIQFAKLFELKVNAGGIDAIKRHSDHSDKFTAGFIDLGGSHIFLEICIDTSRKFAVSVRNANGKLAPVLMTVEVIDDNNILSLTI
jgi:hypothetical protein